MKTHWQSRCPPAANGRRTRLQLTQETASHVRFCVSQRPAIQKVDSMTHTQAKRKQLLSLFRPDEAFRAQFDATERKEARQKIYSFFFFLTALSYVFSLTTLRPAHGQEPTRWTNPSDSCICPPSIGPEGRCRQLYRRSFLTFQRAIQRFGAEVQRHFPLNSQGAT